MGKIAGRLQHIQYHKLCEHKEITINDKMMGNTVRTDSAVLCNQQIIEKSILHHYSS